MTRIPSADVLRSSALPPSLPPPLLRGACHRTNSGNRHDDTVDGGVGGFARLSARAYSAFFAIGGRGQPKSGASAASIRNTGAAKPFVIRLELVAHGDRITANKPTYRDAGRARAALPRPLSPRCIYQSRLRSTQGRSNRVDSSDCAVRLDGPSHVPFRGFHRPGAPTPMPERSRNQEIRGLRRLAWLRCLIATSVSPARVLTTPLCK